LSPILGIWASQNYPRITSSYESIATYTVGSGGSSSISFTSIPSTYTHLQLRCLINATSYVNSNIRLNINSDTGANYTNHPLIGYYNNNSGNILASAYTTSSGRNYSQAAIINGFASPVAIIWDFLDYTNTNKYKTLRCFYGTENNSGSSNEVGLNSTLWLSTNAISNLQVTLNNLNLPQYSLLALYGIKGA
jgi:hypothetical protein